MTGMCTLKILEKIRYFFVGKFFTFANLIGVGETTHTAHATKHIVVNSVHLDVTPGFGEVEVKGGVIDTREIASASGLMLLGAKSEREHVNSNRWHILVTGIGDNVVDPATGALLHAVMSVKLKLSSLDRVNAGGNHESVDDGRVNGIRIVEPLNTTVIHSGGGFNVGGWLGHEDNLLHGVVEVELGFEVGLASGGLRSRELELFNEVLVGDLGHPATLISVEVDIVDKEGGRLKVREVGEGGVTRGIGPAALFDLAELKADTDLVVLQGNEGESKTRVAAEPELEWDEESGTSNGGARRGGHSRGLADHVGVTHLMPGGLGELIPNMEPLAIMLIDTLATNFNRHFLDKDMSEPVEPTELATPGRSHRRDAYLEINGGN
jgi:hypothetical protein